MDYRAADLSVRSRAALTGPSLDRFRESVPGAVVLSTCNRTEVYVAELDPETVIDAWGEEFRPYLTIREGGEVARHLFRVVAGLESAVLGEAEIVSQVREAHRVSRSGAPLDLLFRRALEAGKRVRTETELSHRTVSVGSLAVSEARARHGSLASAETLILGAGQIAERVAKVLHANGAGRVRVLNRSVDRARALAEPYGFGWGSLAEVNDVLLGADIVFAAITAQRPLITRVGLEKAFAARPEKKMTVVDLGVPPNVEEGYLRPSLELLNLDALTERSLINGERRLAAVPVAEAIIEEEILRYDAEVHRRHSRTPLLTRGA